MRGAGSEHSVLLAVAAKLLKATSGLGVTASDGRQLVALFRW
jgi:hypothetical protein